MNGLPGGARAGIPFCENLMSLIEPRADFLQRFGGKRRFHRHLVSAYLGLQLTREGNRVHDTVLFGKSGQDTFAYGPSERRRNAIGGEDAPRFCIARDSPQEIEIQAAWLKKS
jgi:hypothetical protein